MPKSFLESHQDEPESDCDSEDEMSLEQDLQKIELLKVLDNLCCQFIDFINRTCLTGNYFQKIEPTRIVLVDSNCSLDSTLKMGLHVF